MRGSERGEEVPGSLNNQLLPEGTEQELTHYCKEITKSFHEESTLVTRTPPIRPPPPALGIPFPQEIWRRQTKPCQAANVRPLQTPMGPAAVGQLKQPGLSSGRLLLTPHSGPGLWLPGPLSGPQFDPHTVFSAGLCFTAPQLAPASTHTCLTLGARVCSSAATAPLLPALTRP